MKLNVKAQDAIYDLASVVSDLAYERINRHPEENDSEENRRQFEESFVEAVSNVVLSMMTPETPH